MKRYSKNSKPFIYVAYPDNKKDDVFNILETLNKDNIEFWYEDSYNKKEYKRLQSSFALLLFITNEFAGSERFHQIVDDAVKLNKNILCIYLEDVKKTTWMKLQLSSQQALSLTTVDEDFINKLKSSFIFKNMKVTKTQKSSQRNKALVLIVIPVVIALIAFFTIIKPYMAELEGGARQESIKQWGLTESDLETIYEIHLVGNMSFESRVYAKYEGNNIKFSQYAILMDKRFHVINEGYTTTGSLENKDLEIVQYMPNLKSLDLEGQQISDISPLFNTNIEQLRLCCNPITSLEGIQKMKNLKELAISSTNITDISPVYELNNLETLWIDDTEITDISGLINNKKLKELNITGSKVRKVPPFNSVKDVRFIAEDIYFNDYSFLDNIKSIDELMVLNKKAGSVLPHLDGKQVYDLTIEKISSLDYFNNITILPLASISLASPLLNSLEGIEKLEGVSEIKILYYKDDAIKISDLTPLTRLNSLEKVLLNKEMKDLVELQLKDIKFTVSYENTSY